MRFAYSRMNPAGSGGNRAPSAGEPSPSETYFQPPFFIPPNTGGSFSPFLLDSLSRSQLLVPSTEQDTEVGVKVQVRHRQYTCSILKLSLVASCFIKTIYQMYNMQ